LAAAEVEFLLELLFADVVGELTDDEELDPVEDVISFPPTDSLEDGMLAFVGVGMIPNEVVTDGVEPVEFLLDVSEIGGRDRFRDGG
jgi:hypothetical protein